MKKLCYFFTLISLMALSSCAFGGNANRGTAEGGKISIPATVTKQEGQPVGRTCYSEAGPCQMEEPLSLNDSCECLIFGYGLAQGKVRN